MDINATLIGQFITFAILVFFTMKYVWPPILKALHEREKKIASGLEAALQSQRELVLSEQQAVGIIRDARQQAVQMLEQAHAQSAQIVEEAKKQAKEEGERIIEMAQHEVNRAVIQAKEGLKSQLASLAIAGAEKIIKRQLDPAIHHDLLDEFVSEI